MKLHQLKAFLAAAETGSIRAAARKMELSQAALTKALRELEDSLGAALVQRSVRGVQLTPSGAKLLVRAQLIVRQMELAESEVRQLEGDEGGTVTLGVTPLVMLTTLPQAVVDFQHRHRNVRLHIKEGYEGIIIPGVRQGALDFGIMIISEDQLAQDLEFDYWFSTPSTVVMRQDHPRAGARTLAELADQAWLATSFGATGRGGKIATYFARNGLPAPERTVRCDSVAMANALVRTSDVLTLAPVPMLDCLETTGLRSVELATPPPRNHFGMVTRADLPLSPLASAFAALLRKLTVPRFTAAAQPRRRPAGA